MPLTRALVIIPTYNEADNVENILRAVLEQQPKTPDVTLSVLIVDDNSPDGTAAIVKKLQDDSAFGPEKVHLLSRPGKMGLGTAYVEGFKYGLSHSFDYIFEMDADFSHDPEEIPNFLREIRTYDLVLGSRYITGANVANWPLRRLLLSYYANKYARIVTGLKVYDTTGGFKCFRREVLEAIDLDSIHSNGYAFQIEMNFRVWRKKFKIKEIPIVFVDRRAGTSKMNKSIVREAVTLVWKLKMKTISGEL